MNKKAIKVISLILISCIVLISINNICYASSVSDIIKQGDDFRKRGEANNPISADKVAEIIQPITSVLLGVGSVVIIIAIVVIGINYVTASPDKQGQLKKQLVGIAVSSVVLYGAYGIWSLVYNLMNSITS